MKYEGADLQYPAFDYSRTSSGFSSEKALDFIGLECNNLAEPIQLKADEVRSVPAHRS